MNKKRLVLIAGNVGSGKTTIARELAGNNGWVFLDKDDIGEPLLKVAMHHMVGDKNDRDSEFYVRHMRSTTYKTFMTVGKSILKASYVTTVMNAPFTSELHNPKWVKRISKWCVKHDVELHIFWIECNREVRLKRITQRGAKRDLFKLENWEEWIQTLTPVPDHLHNLNLIVNNYKPISSVVKNIEELITTS